MDKPRSTHLDRRRKQQVVEIVHDLLRAALIHREVQRLYQRGALRFRHVEELIDDRGNSILYRLKGNCHALFRHNNHQSPREEGRLLDFAVGSIFHEAMKLRENLYQVEMYRPGYSGIQLKQAPDRAGLLDRFEKIFQRAEQGVEEGLTEIKALFRDTLDHLIDLIRESGDNDLLVRALLTHRKLVVKVYGKRNVERLFASMYRNGLSQAYWVGAMSYLQSGYYEMAARLFSKSVDLAPGDRKRKFLYGYARALHAYYRNDYDRALRFFAHLSAVNCRFKGRRAYVNQAIQICQDIVTECLAQQDRRMVRQASRTVSRLRKPRG